MALHGPLRDDMLAPVAGNISLEVIEGPDAGKQIVVDRAIVIGRAPESDLVLEDGEVSGQHVARHAVTRRIGDGRRPRVDQRHVRKPERAGGTDAARPRRRTTRRRRRARAAHPQDIASRPSAVIQIPPAMAMAPREPTYVNPEVRQCEPGAGTRGRAVRRRRASDRRQVPRRQGAAPRPARATRAVHTSGNRSHPLLLTQVNAVREAAAPDPRRLRQAVCGDCGARAGALAVDNRRLRPRSATATRPGLGEQSQLTVLREVND